ncbi:MAG TPA: lysophospholipid acyltransferase family protein [Jatrophihabitantaceae bacterium]|nr:lysophospholipid acyltransferase family protein [Jatrophihabitantaceae bacterium]
MSAASAYARRALWRTVFTVNGGLDVHGTLPPGGCVVVANHCAHADAPSLLAAIDAKHRPVVAAAADYWFERPLKAWVCRTVVGGFPVRRSGGGYRDLAAQCGSLADGRAVVVFPAGSRRAADGRFHEGAFRLARQAGVPVVPVRLSGTDRVLRPGGHLPRRARICVSIGAPVHVHDPAATAHATQAALALTTPGAAIVRRRPTSIRQGRARVAPDASPATSAPRTKQPRRCH